MGKKIFYDDALKLGDISQNDSIYNPHNKYGYKINVNHPQIKPLYEKFKHHINAKILSDTERLQFEAFIFKMIEKKNRKEAENEN